MGTGLAGGGAWFSTGGLYHTRPGEGADGGVKLALLAAGKLRQAGRAPTRKRRVAAQSTRGRYKGRPAKKDSVVSGGKETHPRTEY